MSHFENDPLKKWNFTKESLPTNPESWSAFCEWLSTVKIQESSHNTLPWDELVKGMVHKINNPLAILSMTLQKMKILDSREKLSMESVRAEMLKLQSSAERIRILVKTLGEMTLKTESPDQANPAHISVKEVATHAKDALNQAFSKHNHQIFWEVPKNLETKLIRGNIDGLVKSIAPLVHNSLEAIEDRGPGKVTLRFFETEGHLSLSIEDNGPGMDSESQKHCMDLFYSTKPPSQGLGLGLYMARRGLTAQNIDLVLLSATDGCQFCLHWQTPMFDSMAA